jgi:hypothetical protein
MLTAKTTTNNNENHNAQRIVIIPFRFRASSPAKPCSYSNLRAEHPGGRPPVNRYRARPQLEHRWVEPSDFKEVGIGMGFLVGDQRTVDRGASVTSGTV